MGRVRRGALLALLAMAPIPAQTQEAPVAFEVASIKPSDPNQGMAFKRSGNHIATTSTSIEWLITWAYDVPSDRIYGKPRWLDAARYDIVANAPENWKQPDRRPGEITHLQLMMQSLLRERFQLAIHSEKRELPMYALVAAPGGLKIHVAKLEGEMGQNPFSMPGRGRLKGNPGFDRDAGEGVDEPTRTDGAG
jgi:uncharacterized protein (TIGR03435 family)